MVEIPSLGLNCLWQSKTFTCVYMYFIYWSFCYNIHRFIPMGWGVRREGARQAHRLPFKYLCFCMDCGGNGGGNGLIFITRINNHCETHILQFNQYSEPCLIWSQICGRIGPIKQGVQLRRPFNMGLALFGLKIC